jgi:hypothetical protein
MLAVLGMCRAPAACRCLYVSWQWRHSKACVVCRPRVCEQW